MIWGNPVLQRELRLISQNWRVSIMLALVATVTGALAFLYLAVASGGAPGAGLPTRAGAQLLGLLSAAQLAMLLLIAPGLTAGALSGERERQTLEPLWQTGLPASALTIGKLGGAVAYLFLLLVVTTPAMGMLLLLGGVTINQIALVYGVQAGTGLMLASIGLCASAFARRTQAAAATAYGLTFILLVATTVPAWMAGDALVAWGVPKRYFERPAMVNPVTALAASIGGPFYTPVLTALLGPVVSPPRVGSTSVFATAPAAPAGSAQGLLAPIPTISKGFLLVSSLGSLLLTIVATFAVRPPSGWGLIALIGQRRRKRERQIYEMGGESHG